MNSHLKSIGFLILSVGMIVFVVTGCSSSVPVAGAQTDTPSGSEPDQESEMSGAEGGESDVAAPGDSSEENQGVAEEDDEPEVVPPANPALKIGYIDPGTDQFVPVDEGDALTVYPGFQGFVDVFLTIQVSGLDPAADVLVTLGMTRVSDGGTLAPSTTGRFSLAPLDADTGEIRDRHLVLVASPSTVEGQTVRLSITVADFLDPSVSTSQVQTVVLELQAQ